ncbi:hypothetical protein MGYG_03098 [Nannizzia gypsea CBS 118893]|uniref:Uncharacterized protein n=1 Tax=Arthroderma gypseum (strain ATCC MYA-4604 / CBS 118893) TaxID=535722 RepID=E4UQS4_ARTGP|nr:hypothetical protein MGYG_03098 [Nannizzia gypsea CBS 118893]EFR00092.1 hypothetical protein MGYG_03098 [Nannizzia gypsea CBS 118893]
MLASSSHIHGQVAIASGPAPPSALNDSHLHTKEVTEYEKILNIRDQIFAGTHPRLRVPESVIRKVPPRSVVQTSPSSTSAPVFVPSSQASASEPAPPSSFPPAHHAAQATATSSPWPQPASTAAGGDTDSPVTGASTPKPTSEIDPIFLTKSDDLIRAETQLQRQRLERTLRDYAEQKRIEERQKPPLQELKPDFDVSDVFNKALEIVKPLSPPYDHDNNTGVDGDGDRANNGNAASDSFDDNSYYSSRAPDSPQNEEYDEDMAPAPPLAGNMDTDESDETVIVDRARANEPGHDSAAGNHHLLGQHANIDDDARRDLENIQPWTEDNEHHYSPPEPYEEPEYSPPGPDLSLNGRRDLLEPSYLSPSSRRQQQQPPPMQQPSGQQSPAPRNLRVVRNHITSPAAPQPSRVSPLAVTRVSSIAQSRQGRQSRQAAKASADQGSERTSPEHGPSQQLMSRKRRRLQQAHDKKKLEEERRAAASPDMPYIKPEPVSPPPFIPSAVAHYPRGRLVQEVPADVDYVSRHDDHVIAGRVPAYDDGHGRNYELESPIELHTPRTTSRIGYKRPNRDEHDLRRVASLQHARQTEYVQEYPEPVAEISPRHGRAVSYAEPIHSERTRYHDEGQPAQYTTTRRYMTRPLSPHYRESYAPVRVSESRAMGPPPPQRRIVVDAEGNRFYESIDAPRAMPPASARVPRAEPYDGVSHAPARSMSIVDDHYRDRRYIQEMPPPEITYRRNPGPNAGPGSSYAADNEFGEPRYYDREPAERGPVMRSASVQVIDYPSRQTQHLRQSQTSYVDDPHFPHEEIVRVASVRPLPVGVPRYEEHHEVRPRMTSVRPMRREVSVYVDDEVGHAREYPPVERYGGGPSYTARPMREERFYESAGPGRIEADEGSEVIRRVPRQY